MRRTRGLPAEARLRRGGQPGNQNARKHGFFSASLDPEDVSQFWYIVTRQKVDPEIALVRLKLHSSLQHDPSNRSRLLEEAARLLAKWYSPRLHLNKVEHSFFRKAILNALENCYPIQNDIEE